MVDFFNITDWNEKPHFQTKGTRSKCVVENPQTSELYFFKTSMIKEGRNYKHEFWSEIIASAVGTELGFNVLKYDIAQKDMLIGCISKNMCEPDQSLIEGVSLLTAYDNSYSPDDKASYKDYTFQFICEVLISLGMQQHIHKIIDVIIFDSIIGNSDRHQENWGIISLRKRELDSNQLSKFKEFLSRLKKPSQSNGMNIRPLFGEFAPIYDSGCCLAREFEDEKIASLLKNKDMFEGLINRAKTEIRWEGKNGKLKHYEVIKEIAQFNQEYKDYINSKIDDVFKYYKKQKVENIIYNIDDKLPNSLEEHKLPLNRKQLIAKIVNKRLELLKEILS